MRGHGKTTRGARVDAALDLARLDNRVIASPKILLQPSMPATRTPSQPPLRSVLVKLERSWPLVIGKFARIRNDLDHNAPSHHLRWS
jgi:hypothetical protein